MCEFGVIDRGLQQREAVVQYKHDTNSLSDDHSELAPPDPIPNSVVKRLSADGSVGFPHVRVGHRQTFIPRPLAPCAKGFFYARLPLTYGHTQYVHFVHGAGSRTQYVHCIHGAGPQTFI